jgi:hypothetical protein
MTNTVDISDFVNATLTITATAIPYENFSIPMIIGDSNVIDVNQRFRTYSNLLGVSADFGTTASEYLAAQVFFEQSPQPKQCMIGRWARTATAGLLHGASLTAIQMLMSNFTSVTSGAFSLFIDGVPYTVAGLNFSTALNLNGVASAIQTGLNALNAGTTCVWGSVNQRFNITSPTTGATSSVSYASAPTAWASAAFSGQPTAADVLTVNGTAVTFVSALTTGNQVLIGSSLANTLTALASFLNTSADVNIVKATYSVVGSTLYAVSKVTGTAGNAYTMARTSSVITVSGANFTGGSGTDISTLLGLTQAAGASPPVLGLAAETPLAAWTALAGVSSQWYAAAFAASVQPNTADYLAVGAATLASARKRIFGVTIITTDCLDPTNTSDLATSLQSLNNDRVFWWYDPINPYGVLTMFGRASTVKFNASQSTITLAYKQAPGLTAAYLTETQLTTLQGKGGNCNIAVNNGAVMIWPGQMSDSKWLAGTKINGTWFDEIHNCDWFLNAVQTDVFNALYTTTTKIPQTDAGSNILATVMGKTCSKSVNNGMVAPGVWNGPPFGTLETGDTLATGWYVYYPPIALQSPADRDSRVSVPFQIAVKLAGAVHTVDLAITVDR